MSYRYDGRPQKVNKCACCPNVIEDDDSSPLPVKERVLCTECRERAKKLTDKIYSSDVVVKGSNLPSGWGFM